MTTPDNAAATEKAVQAAQPKRAPKTFLQTLQDHHYGHTADEATARLKEALDASERTGKATEVTIKMKIRPVSKAAGRYDVTVDVTNKLPAKDIEAAIMFVGPDGNLTNNDPRQQVLPGIRVVDGPREALRPQDEEQQQAGIRVAS